MCQQQVEKFYSKSVVVIALLTKHKHITNCMIVINCMCVHDVFMHCTGVILVEIIVTAVR